MLNLRRKNYWIIGLGIAAFSFIMFFIGVKVILGNEININNFVSLLGFSVLTGIIVLFLIYFNLRISFLSFITGLVFGFIIMYLNFMNEMSGWGDLIGILSLFTWTAIGLVLGLLLQSGYFLYGKLKKRSNNDMEKS